VQQDHGLALALVEKMQARAAAIEKVVRKGI
jgi:hypothetical protein